MLVGMKFPVRTTIMTKTSDFIHSLVMMGLLAVIASSPIVASGESLKSGAGRFEFHHEGKTVPVWYFLPEGASAEMPVWIVMHGVGRDANRYRDEWRPHAEKHRFILVAPEFSEAEFPGNDGYALGGMKEVMPGGHVSKASSFSFIEPIFDAVKEATGNRSERYQLFGHSAGAQFVHRYLYFMPEARVARAVAANAGWWTVPDRGVDFPYGLRGSMIDDAMLKTMLQRQLIVLLGTADVDPNDKNLRRTPEALAQGPHRFARGHTFFEAGQRQAAALGIQLGWKLDTAPGVAHSDSGMAEFAVKWLLGGEATK